MDLRGCVFVVIVLIHSLCFAVVSSTEDDGYDEVSVWFFLIQITKIVGSGEKCP